MMTNFKMGIGATIGALILLTAPVGAVQKIKSTLTATGVIPGAKGTAKLLVKSASIGRFEVKVRKLRRRASYSILVGTVNVAALTTSGGGNGKVSFRTADKGTGVPMGFDPRGNHIAVRDANGDDVLGGDIDDASGSASGGFVCCRTSDDRAECELRAADACVADGGTVGTATSCLPNPCGDSTTGAFIACCEPEDDGTPDCDLRTSTACLSHGGVVGTATTCDPNPCTTTFPSTDIQCCLPAHGDDGGECEARTPADCLAQGGTDMGAGSCHPNPCPAGSGGDGGNEHGGQGGGDSNRGSGGHGGHDD